MGIRYLLSYARAHLLRQVTFDLKKPVMAKTEENSDKKQQYIIFDALSLMRRYFCQNFLFDFEYMRNRVKLDVDAFKRAGNFLNLHT